MENRARPSSDFLSETIVRKFFVAMLTIAVLSGAVLVTHSRPSAAHGYGGPRQHLRLRMN